MLDRIDTCPVQAYVRWNIERRAQPNADAVCHPSITILLRMTGERKMRSSFSANPTWVEILQTDNHGLRWAKSRQPKLGNRR